MVPIEDVADDLRVHWDLGLAAIHNLIDVLEQQGIGVIITSVDADNQFDGLVGTIEGHPFIVVSDQWPGDRQRFTLAHELGHLIMDRSEEHTSELQSRGHLVCRLLLEKKKSNQQW